MKYQINIDQLFKVWQKNTIEVEFDGTKEELEQYIKNKKGDLAELNPEYVECESLLDTEEYAEEYDEVSIEEI